MSPHVLKQVILELDMSMSITQFPMKLDKLFKGCRRWMLGLNIFTLEIKPFVVDAIIGLILHDHVVHDHTNNHHLPKLLRAPCQCRVTNDTPPRLKHTESTLHILPSTLLHLGKPLSLLTLRIGYGIHKSGPPRIDAMS